LLAMRPFFTVFTSAFNRADTIGRVYDSLKNQTYQDFEWLVVDAGSDNTGRLIEQWQGAENGFPIRYHRQENRGKHGAINFGLREASGTLFVMLDDDDECVPETLERFKHHWDAIPSDERKRFAGIGVLAADEDGYVVGDRYPRDVMESTFQELAYVYRVQGEKWWAFSTAALREFPFPEEPEARIIPEGMIYHRLTQRYRFRFVNEILRRYRRDHRQLTKGNPGSHPLGNRIHLAALLDEDLQWLPYHPELFFRYAVHYSRFSFHNRLGLVRQLRGLGRTWAKVLVLISWPFGFVMYCVDRLRT
jgi:glycosyltransferase involved in cell wall biosynthesis